MMGDACSHCKGTGKSGSKAAGGSGPERPCWACNGTGMVQAQKGRRK